MRSATALSLGLFVVVGIPHVVRAQSARIIGHTHASGDSTRSVPGAEVTMTPGNRTARADSAGTFVFPSVADGTYILRVRRLGFVAREARVLIIAQHDETVSVPLDVSTRFCTSCCANTSNSKIR